MVVISLLTNFQVLLYYQNQGYNNTYYVESIFFRVFWFRCMEWFSFIRQFYDVQISKNLS